MHRHKLERDEHLHKAFQYFDKDGSGWVSYYFLVQMWEQISFLFASFASFDNINLLSKVLRHLFSNGHVCPVGPLAISIRQKIFLVHLQLLRRKEWTYNCLYDLVLIFHGFWKNCEEWLGSVVSTWIYMILNSLCWWKLPLKNAVTVILPKMN